MVENIIQYTGREKIMLSYEKKDINAALLQQVLPEVLRIHDKNAQEIDYLYNFYKGNQPILWKKKTVRPDINHIVLENHAFEIVEFKKSYIYGEPIQYVQRGEKDSQEINPEISELNKFMEGEDKASLDKEIAEWQYICGTAYRWVDVDSSVESGKESDEAPFEMSVPDPRRTFVVYSSGIKEEPLFSGYYSYFSETVQTETNQPYINKYRMITIYTDSEKYLFKSSALEEFELVTQQLILPNNNGKDVEAYPLIIKGNRIIEYPLNNARLGLIELVMSGLNAINQIKSNDVDDIDQFVQSLLVFINQQIDIEEFQKLIRAGAIEVVSSDPSRPADVKLLTSQLLHSETKIVLDDLYNNILTICGIPRMNSKSTGGDTGQARLLGEGWTMADERAKQDELTFKKSERRCLKLILNICKQKGFLKKLKNSDIEIKFTRNKSDNLLVKTQGLLNMKQSQVPPETAFAICGLFSDPNDVYGKGVKYYGEDFWKVNEGGQNPNNAFDESNNILKDNRNIINKNPANGDNN